MATFDVPFLEDQIQAGAIKPKHIILDTSKERRDYICVNKVSKCKTGKHGAAKVMLTGKNLKDGKTWIASFNGGQMITVATMTKKQFVIEDIFERDDSFYMRPYDNSGTECDIYSYVQVDPEEVKKVTSFFESNNKKSLLVTIVLAQDFFKFDDIKVLE